MSLILSGESILKFEFLHGFLLHSSFYGWYYWLCGSYCYLLVYYLLLAVLVFYWVFVMISTISCVGRTVIYLYIICFLACFGLLLGIRLDPYD